MCAAAGVCCTLRPPFHQGEEEMNIHTEKKERSTALCVCVPPMGGASTSVLQCVLACARKGKLRGRHHAVARRLYRLLFRTTLLYSPGVGEEHH